MKKTFNPVGSMGGDIDSMVPGKIVEIELEADTPFPFPPADEFPNAGRFSIRVPAGATVELRIASDGVGYPLDAGHWDLSFWKPGNAHLYSAAGATVVVMQQRES